MAARMICIGKVIALWVVLVLVLCSDWVVPVAAFSADSSSPWAPARWRFVLDVGREAGTDMPKTWGTSGARLVLPVDVVVESESCPTRDEWVGGSGGGGLSVLRPLEEARFINERGEQRVRVKEGGWKIAFPPGNKKGHAATLQFWLDIETEATRNDVTLPAERIYFGANCWREPDLEQGKRAIAPLIYNYETAQRTIEEKLSHETGDRRLDGTDPIETMKAYKDMTELVVYRDEMLRRLKDASQYLPMKNADTNKELPQGHWPGSTDLLSIAPSEMFTKRKKLFGEDFLLLGKWEAVPIKVKENNNALQ
jgi:hypothetical protein|uniref:Uncharacterized protein n=1 Tax=Attheya septentrionalis TaxID=420275 RepID=A0A7S2UC49_9STRA|mmetsp:Transcript_17674/g.31931  ORF Transcript_17674/g.31931 Transcript_17674/m.31931 type:complete len:310 (+) Transcript_17674:94-1023(+)